MIAKYVVLIERQITEGEDHPHGQDPWPTDALAKEQLRSELLEACEKGILVGDFRIVGRWVE